MGAGQHDSETLAEGQQVFTACAFIWRKESEVKQVFLARRADTKKFLPGVWELPGGHIDYGEDMCEGLAREVMEEFGMHVNIGEVLDVFTYMNEVKKCHSIEVIYFAQFTDPLENIRLHPEDHSTFGWFALDELEQTYVCPKDAADPEVAAIRKGFACLEIL
ncbi:NUDIX hydrolase [Candidatus Saccharibacteria bacterium]|nr:MAG: NUDIX hydrolase [Candidatus Saccharibacteria bacterium]